MLFFLIAYGAVLVVWAAFVAMRPDYFGNVAFLILGALAGIYPAFLIEEYKRQRDKKSTATAVFQELANRVGRCCYDFEAPWHLHQGEMDIPRLRRFTPDRPVIYPAIAPQIAMFGNDAARALIQFYIFLAGWERDIEGTTEICVRENRDVSATEARRLTMRLRFTLQPGLEALRTLGKQVPNAVEIGLDVMAPWDRLYPDQHPNAGKPLETRIQLMLKGEK